ncbi:hypothetical protein EKK58_10795 [Candidatus Dependentiae bacterium]|nr:MAG: hypothetical protein EKK58_10795 [Candidatus Dependentiae bacterium]
MVIVSIVLLLSSFIMAMEDLSQRVSQNQLSDFKINTVSSIIQGGKSIQEDVVYVPSIITPDQPIVAAVFDGNGGIGQEAINDDLLLRLLKYCNQYNINNLYPKSSISNIFIKINNKLKFFQNKNDYIYITFFQNCLYQAKLFYLMGLLGFDNVVPSWVNAGSTALLLFWVPQDNKFLISWCGDSEAIWSDYGQLKVTDPVHHLQERAGQYSFYRSFGNFKANDQQSSSFVKDSGCQMSAEPESIIINNAVDVQWILMATDGLWTHTLKVEVFDFVNRCLNSRELDSFNFSDQAIVNRIMLLSILNDVTHNLVYKWFQFFFKEYIRIIFPGLRQKNVNRAVYVESLKDKVIELNSFMQGLQIVIDNLFSFFNKKLFVKDYIAQSCEVNDVVIKAQLPAKEQLSQTFFLPDTIQEYEFPPEYNVDAQTKDEKLNSMHDIIRYLYFNLDDGLLEQRLTGVFDLDFDALPINEDNNLFCYKQKCFLQDLKKIFLNIKNAIDIIKKDQLLCWHFDCLDEKIKNIQHFASDNTSIVFITIEKNEQVEIHPTVVQDQQKKDLCLQLDNESLAVNKQNEQFKQLIPLPIEQSNILPVNPQSAPDTKKTQNEDGQSIFSAFISCITLFFSSCWQYFADFLPW